MRVYIVEDEEDVRSSLKLLFDGSKYDVRWFRCRDFLKLSSSLPPGCIILDKDHPRLTGLDRQCQLVRQCVERHEIILFSQPCDVYEAVAAMRAGAIDFFELPYRRTELLDAIARAQLRLEARAAELRESAKKLQLFGKLTEREFSVLNASQNGESSKIAAHRLGLSPRTVEMHRSRILRKLKVDTFAGALVMAQSAQLLSASTYHHPQ